MYQTYTTATRCGAPVPYLIMAHSTLQGELARRTPPPPETGVCNIPCRGFPLKKRSEKGGLGSGS
jgi:hypothetical protein